ncbi:MAG: hypothetical protein V1928_00760 [Parcubacteria group bacterium]
MKFTLIIALAMVFAMNAQAALKKAPETKPTISPTPKKITRVFLPNVQFCLDAGDSATCKAIKLRSDISDIFYIDASESVRIKRDGINLLFSAYKADKQYKSYYCYCPADPKKCAKKDERTCYKIFWNVLSSMHRRHSN